MSLVKHGAGETVIQQGKVYNALIYVVSIFTIVFFFCKHLDYVILAIESLLFHSSRLLGMFVVLNIFISLTRL